MKKMICLLLSVLCLFTAVALAADSDTITKNGKLIVGITDFAPMDYKDADGKWIGFDADLARLFAESLGVDVEFVEIDWDNKVLELNAGSIDCVWNGMTLTDEVMSAMECTNPYSSNSQTIVAPADAAAGAAPWPAPAISNHKREKQ